MKLAVTGNHSLTKLQDLATQMFSTVENKQVVLPDYSKPSPPFDSQNLGKFTRWVPVQDKDRLQIYWVLPDCHREYKTKPLGYFAHLLGHEGENSLLSHLKKEGLVLELGAANDHELGVYSDFELDILLTKKGLSNVEQVLASIFHYVRILCEVGPTDYLFDEAK